MCIELNSLANPNLEKSVSLWGTTAEDFLWGFLVEKWIYILNVRILHNHSLTCRKVAIVDTCQFQVLMPLSVFVREEQGDPVRVNICLSTWSVWHHPFQRCFFSFHLLTNQFSFSCCKLVVWCKICELCNFIQAMALHFYHVLGCEYMSSLRDPSANLDKKASKHCQ